MRSPERRSGSGGAAVDTCGVPLALLAAAVQACGGDDLLLFSRLTAQRLAHLGGTGRGAGWAGIVEVELDRADEAWLALVSGEVRRVEATAGTRQIIGPYHAGRAVLVPVDGDVLVVIGSRDAGLDLALGDAHYRDLAGAAVEAVTSVSPAKRLADELEVLHAVQALVAIDTSQPLPDVLAAIARAAGEALSCEVAAIVAAGLPAVGVRVVTAPASGREPGALAVARVLDQLHGEATGARCVQEAASAPLPGISAGVCSWMLVPLTGAEAGALLLVHTERTPRGFTRLCQELGQRLGEAASSVVLTAVSRAHLLAEASAARRASERDVLTGLGNRAAWERLLDEAQERCTAGTSIGAIVLDLDGLKAVNDRDGHAAGDALLRRTADLLRVAWPRDPVVRLGGDEFAVLVDGGEVEVLRRLASLRSTLAGCADGLPVPAVSTGGCWNRPAEDVRSCVRRADAAMYERKRGRDSAAGPPTEGAAVTASPGGPDADEPGRGASRRRGRPDRRDGYGPLVADLERLLHAPADDLDALGFSVAYQPLLRAQGLRLEGVEALARWRHPRLGPIGPDVFVRLAEEHGWVDRLDRLVVARAMVTHARALAADPDRQLAVNVSARHLGAPDLAELVLATLAGAGVPPRLLTVEVTETAVTDDIGAAVDTLAALRAEGVRVAVDDFGTGWSSLQRLARFPMDQIKVDRSFLEGADVPGRAADVLVAAVQLARGLGAEVCVEGIETVSQLRLAVGAGADLVQGFLLGRPVPADELPRGVSWAAGEFAVSS